MQRQLFDLEADPYEMTNRVDDPGFRETAAEHHTWLRQRLEETLDPQALAAAFGQTSWNQWQQKG